jgi:hypothetical protein
MGPMERGPTQTEATNNSATDDVPTINAAPMVVNGNRAVEFLYPAASTNTAAPPPSDRYYYGNGGFPH